MALDIPDRLAIQELLERYCHNADYNPPERMREMFASDGIFEVPAMELRFEGVDSSGLKVISKLGVGDGKCPVVG